MRIDIAWELNDQSRVLIEYEPDGVIVDRDSVRYWTRRWLPLRSIEAAAAEMANDFAEVVQPDTVRVTICYGDNQATTARWREPAVTCEAPPHLPVQYHPQGLSNG